MSTSVVENEAAWTAADLVERFGPILLHRIRSNPAPGTATEQHVIDIHAHEDRLFELVDGVLVEKTMGIQESYLAVMIASLITVFVNQEKLGIVLGPDGMARLAPGLVRIPDVSFVGWSQLPNRKVPAVPMLDLAPRLAVEILSPSNTKREMDRKLSDYFEAGVELVWHIDPRARTVAVYLSDVDFVVLAAADTLDGGAVLPGFSVALNDLFAGLDAPA